MDLCINNFLIFDIWRRPSFISFYLNYCMIISNLTRFCLIDIEDFIKRCVWKISCRAQIHSLLPYYITWSLTRLFSIIPSIRIQIYHLDYWNLCHRFIQSSENRINKLAYWCIYSSERKCKIDRRNKYFLLICKKCL